MKPALRALVVDDEPLSRRAMVQLLAAHADVHVIATCDDAREAERHLGDADVLFLDIQLPGPSGLDFARGLARTCPPWVVFVTAYDAYAVPAFETEALDYLPKPVSPERLEQALARVRTRQALFGRATGDVLERLVTRVGTQEVVIPVPEIDWIEADGVYVSVHARGRQWLVRQSLDALEAALPPAAFLRVHRGWLVPVAGIERVRRAEGDRRELVLRGGAVAPVSRRRAAEVLRAIRSR